MPLTPDSRLANPDSKKMPVEPQTTTKAPAFKRILLKASGEALMGAQKYGVDVEVARSIAEEIRAIHELGVVAGNGAVVNLDLVIRAPADANPLAAERVCHFTPIWVSHNELRHGLRQVGRLVSPESSRCDAQPSAEGFREQFRRRPGLM